MPSAVTMILVGVKSLPMTLWLGKADKGQYQISLSNLPMVKECLRYYFTVINTDGKFRYPESGYYGAWFDGNLANAKFPNIPGVDTGGYWVCYDNWLEEKPRSPLKATPSALNLPPSVGETFRAELGPGLGPWGPIAIAQDGFWMAALPLPRTNSTMGKVFIPTIPYGPIFDKAEIRYGNSVPGIPLRGYYAGDVHNGHLASSSDGKNLVVAQSFGGILRSDDSGASWSNAGTKSYWARVASSSDGVKLVAVERLNPSARLGSIFTSADSGLTWRRQEGAPVAMWSGVASSSNGSHLVAVQFSVGSKQPGYIFTSSDSGFSWHQSDIDWAFWAAVASSSDGSKIVAVQEAMERAYPTDLGCIWTSGDYGQTWVRQRGAGEASWRDVASSSDGMKLVAVQGIGDKAPWNLPGAILTSEDAGSTWKQQYGAGTGNWNAVASSADGITIAAAQYMDQTRRPGSILVSINSGLTWIPVLSAGTAYWSGIALSDDGFKLTALKEADQYGRGSIFTSSYIMGGLSRSRRVLGNSNWHSFGETTLLVGDWAAVIHSGFWDALVAVQRRDSSGDPGSIYVSFDYGSGWYIQDNEGAGKGYWAGVATASLAPVVVALQKLNSSGLPGSIFVSHNFNSISRDYTQPNWARADSAGTAYWGAAALSGDGSQIAAVQIMDNSGLPGYIVMSYDSGSSWYRQDGAGRAYWSGIVCSHGGSRLVAIQNMSSSGQPGSIVMSNDSGRTWNIQVTAGTAYWAAIASSADTSVLAAVQSMDDSGRPGSIFISQDYGVHWTRDPVFPQAQWAGVAVAGDGSVFMAAPGGNSSGGIHIGIFRPFPPIGVVVAAGAAAGVAAGVGIGKFFVGLRPRGSRNDTSLIE